MPSSSASRRRKVSRTRSAAAGPQKRPVPGPGEGERVPARAPGSPPVRRRPPPGRDPVPPGLPCRRPPGPGGEPEPALCGTPGPSPHRHLPAGARPSGRAPSGTHARRRLRGRRPMARPAATAARNRSASITQSSPAAKEYPPGSVRIRPGSQRSASPVDEDLRLAAGIRREARQPQCLRQHVVGDVFAATGHEDPHQGATSRLPNAPGGISSPDRRAEKRPRSRISITVRTSGTWCRTTTKLQPWLDTVRRVVSRVQGGGQGMGRQHIEDDMRETLGEVLGPSTGSPTSSWGPSGS